MPGSLGLEFIAIHWVVHEIMFTQHSKVIVVSMNAGESLPFSTKIKNFFLLFCLPPKLKYSWTVESYSTQTYKYEYRNLFI